MSTPIADLIFFRAAQLDWALRVSGNRGSSQFVLN